jgi:hypothetical protein
MFLLFKRARSPLLTKMGRIRKFAVEMTRRLNRGESQTGPSRRLETRIKRGFPHSHSDGDGGQPGSDEAQPRVKSEPLTDSCTEPKELEGVKCR